MIRLSGKDEEKDEKYPKNREIYEKRMNFRVFLEEYGKILKIITHAKDFDDSKKYENESHLCRCALIKLIRSEMKELEIKPGRPKK